MSSSVTSLQISVIKFRLGETVALLFLAKASAGWGRPKADKIDIIWSRNRFNLCDTLSELSDPLSRGPVRRKRRGRAAVMFKSKSLGSRSRWSPGSLSWWSPGSLFRYVSEDPRSRAAGEQLCMVQCVCSGGFTCKVHSAPGGATHPGTTHRPPGATHRPTGAKDFTVGVCIW